MPGLRSEGQLCGDGGDSGNRRRRRVDAALVVSFGLQCGFVFRVVSIYYRQAVCPAEWPETLSWRFLSPTRAQKRVDSENAEKAMSTIVSLQVDSMIESQPMRPRAPSRRSWRKLS